MNKKEFEKVFAAAAEKSGVAGMARDYQLAENLQSMMIDLRDKLYPTEQPSEDLEEEITNYINKHYHIRYDETLEVGNDPLTTIDFSEAARHFADWQKEQMMKSSVRGGYIKRNRYTKVNVLHGFSNVCDAIQQFKDNDKVSIIIIKEDEQ